MQPRIFQGRHYFWNKDILINILSTTHALQGKFMVFFLLDDIKTTFQIRHLTHRWIDCVGVFFPKTREPIFNLQIAIIALSFNTATDGITKLGSMQG